MIQSMLQERNFWTVLLLSLVTCGIYYFFWVYEATQDLNTMAGNDGKFVSPGTAVVLFLFTCGIYPLIWYYTQGNRMAYLASQNEVRMDENGNSYPLWYLVGALLCGIGPLVALYLFIANMNKLVFEYNRRTTGPGTANAQ